MKEARLLTLLLVAAVALGACQSNPAITTDAPDTPTETSLPLEESTDPVTAPPTQEANTPTSIIIDGLAGDWKGIASSWTDAEGDQMQFSPDIDRFSAVISDTYLYGMISFHSWGNYDFVDLWISDTEGSQFVLYISPVSGVGSYSRLGENLIPIRLEAAQGDIIEFKVALSELQFIPAAFNNLAICCSIEGPANDSLTLSGVIPTFTENPDLIISNPDRLERPGHVFIVDGNRPVEYLYRSFIQMPVGITWGPDGYLYIADNMGRHIVRLGLDGSAEDLGFWRDPSLWMRNGPEDIAFAPDGTMYIEDRQFIYRANSDGTLEELDATGWPGMIEFGPDGLLYYAETSEEKIYRWDFEAEPELLLSLPRVHDIAFLQDGRMLLSQIGGKVYAVDLETRETTLFFEQFENQDPIYVTVDAAGDVWVRGIGMLDIVAPDGVEKSFVVNGRVIEDWGGGLPDAMVSWYTAADIAFDEYGGLWIPSYNSRVWRLAPPESGREALGMTWENIAPGFETYDMTTGADGVLYTYNENTQEVWKISPEGIVEVVFETDIYGQISLAVDQEGILYMGRSNAEIVRLEEDGSISHYAWLGAQRMTFGSDGALYVAATSEYQDNTEIVRVTGVDELAVVLTELGGEQFGDSLFGGRKAFMGSSSEGGLLIYDMRSARLYSVDLNGDDEQLVYDFGWLPSRPWLMGVAPNGTPYFMYHTELQAHQLGRINSDGELEPIANDVAGDPFAMTFSPDGAWLYIADSGAISKIPLDAGE